MGFVFLNDFIRVEHFIRRLLEQHLNEDDSFCSFIAVDWVVGQKHTFGKVSAGCVTEPL